MMTYKNEYKRTTEQPILSYVLLKVCHNKRKNRSLFYCLSAWTRSVFMLITDLITEYLFDCQIRRFTEKTIKSYRNNLCYFANYLNTTHNVTDIEKVDTFHLKSFLKELSDNGRKESYINSLIKTFRAFFKYALEEEYIKTNPCLKVRWAKETESLIETFTDAEVKRMLSAFNDTDYMQVRNKAIMYMLFDTGIRNYELCCLPLSAIKENIITIMGKGKKERQVAKSPHLEKMLIKYMRYRNSYFVYKNIPDNLFLSRTGKPLTDEAVQRIVRIAATTANVRDNIRSSPHTCRHYFAQCQLRNGIDVYSLSRLMGHTNIKITQRYLSSLNDSDIVEKSVKTSPLMRIM